MKLRFRNYRPRDSDVGAKSIQIRRALPSNIDEAIAEILSLAKQNSAVYNML